MTGRKDNGAEGKAVADGTRDAIAAAEADGVEWTLENTEPCVKVFRVELRLDVGGRIKLGLLASRAGVSPRRYGVTCGGPTRGGGFRAVAFFLRTDGGRGVEGPRKSVDDFVDDFGRKRG